MLMDGQLVFNSATHYLSREQQLSTLFFSCTLTVLHTSSLGTAQSHHHCLVLSSTTVGCGCRALIKRYLTVSIEQGEGEAFSFPSPTVYQGVELVTSWSRSNFS